MIAKLTLKQLAANKMRLFATAFAVILGVAFLAGTLILTDTIKGTFNTVLANADAGTDAYIRGASPLGLGYGQSARPIDATLLDAVRGVDGVEQASIVVSGYAQILDNAGKAVGTPNTGVLGMNWVTVPELNPFTISSGRAPSGADEVAIDKHSADVAKLHVGDRTTVLSAGEPRPATIVGVVRFGNVDTPGALAIVLFDDITAQAVLNDVGQVDAIAVTARNAVSPRYIGDPSRADRRWIERGDLRRDAHQGAPGRHKQERQPVRCVLDDVRPYCPVRGCVHHQQHVLDHRVATHEGDGVAPSSRRKWSPGSPGRPRRGRGHGACRLRCWPHGRDRRGEGFARRCSARSVSTFPSAPR